MVAYYIISIKQWNLLTILFMKCLDLLSPLFLPSSFLWFWKTNPYGSVFDVFPKSTCVLVVVLLCGTFLLSSMGALQLRNTDSHSLCLSSYVSVMYGSQMLFIELIISEKTNKFSFRSYYWKQTPLDSFSTAKIRTFTKTSSTFFTQRDYKVTAPQLPVLASMKGTAIISAGNVRQHSAKWQMTALTAFLWLLQPCLMLKYVKDWAGNIFHTGNGGHIQPAMNFMAVQIPMQFIMCVHRMLGGEKGKEKDNDIKVTISLMNNLQFSIGSVISWNSLRSVPPSCLGRCLFIILFFFASITENTLIVFPTQLHHNLYSTVARPSQDN